MVDPKKILRRLTQLAQFINQLKRPAYEIDLPLKLKTRMAQLIHPEIKIESDEDWEMAETRYQDIMNQFAALTTLDGRHSPLMYFSHAKYIDLFFDLLTRKVDVDFKDKNGYDALMYAASYGSDEQVAALIERGADVKAINADGQTALMKAAQNGSLTKVNLLIAKGADVNLQDEKGITALMFAAKQDHLAVVLILIQHQADVNAVDHSSKSVLIHSIEDARQLSPYDPILRTPQVCYFDNPSKISSETLERPFQFHTIRTLIENGANVFFETRLKEKIHTSPLKTAMMNQWTGIICYYMLKQSTPQHLPKLQEIYRKAQSTHMRDTNSMDRETVYRTLVNHVDSVKNVNDKIAILEDALKPEANALSRFMTGSLGGWTPLIRLKLAACEAMREQVDPSRQRSLSKLFKRYT